MAELEIIRYDRDAQEATVQIHVGDIVESLSFLALVPNQRISLNAFWHPVSCQIQSDNMCLFAFLASDVVQEERMQIPIKTDLGYYSYRLFAKVLDAQNQRVRFGDVDIILDTPIPKDIQDGDIISFHTQRLDL